MPSFIKIGQTVAEIWRFNGFLKWRPFAILDFGNSNFSTVWTVKRPILHNLAKFRKDRSIHCCDIAIFVIFQDVCRGHLVFWKIGNFNDLPPVWGQSAPACQISSKSIKRLLRYGDLTFFFRMAAVRHHGFVGRALGPPAKTTWWSLLLSKIWLESLQYFR